MKNNIYIALWFLFLSPFLSGQVGIGNESPLGILDINSPDSTNTMGLVLPITAQADPIEITGAGRPGTVPQWAPSITTPNSSYQSFSTTETIEGTPIRRNWNVFLEEAPEGTVVYDGTLNCVRVKKGKTSTAPYAPESWSGCLADETTISEEINYRLYGGSNFRVKKASTGYLYSLAIDLSDELYVAGYALAYTSGGGQYVTRTSWTKIFNHKVKDAAAGFYHALAITTDGELYGWGYNAFGQLGSNIREPYVMTPRKIELPDGERASKVLASFYNTMVLTESGKIYMAGYNGFFLRGDGVTANIGLEQIYTQQFTEVKVGVGSDYKTIKDIALGYATAAALDTDGKVHTWGYNFMYGTGRGTNIGFTYVPTPISEVNIPKDTKFEKISIGPTGLAVVEGGKELYAWGNRRNIGMTIETYDVAPIDRTSTLGLEEDEYIKSVTTADDGLDAAAVITPTIVITNKRVLVAGYNITRKIGVVINTGTPSWENKNLPVTTTTPTFTEIQNHSIYDGTVFEGASVGYFQSILWTGENEVNPANNNVAYGSGGLGAWYMTYGSGTQSNYFIPIKK